VAREIGAAPSGIELAEGVARGVEALLRARQGGEIAAVVAEAARGARAALGSAPVTAALERGAVDLLLLTRRMITDEPDTAERLVRSALRFALAPVAPAALPGTTADRARAASP
jgi:hypothetical protein